MGSFVAVKAVQSYVHGQPHSVDKIFHYSLYPKPYAPNPKSLNPKLQVARWVALWR
jgi:hypothetical protein